MPLQTILAMRTNNGIYFQPVDDLEILELLQNQQQLSFYLIKLQGLQKLCHDKLSIYRVRLSDVSTVFKPVMLPDGSNITQPPINPRRTVSSYFSVKYSNKMRARDLATVQKLELELSHREDHILTTRRKLTILNTEIKDCALWMERHKKLDENQHCPFPFHQIRQPKSFNRDYYENPRLRILHNRNSSHPNNIRHLREHDSIQCPTCHARFCQEDGSNVLWRFAKLKSENFFLRLRRSYSLSNVEIVEKFTEHFIDYSTGIFVNPKMTTTQEASYARSHIGSAESETATGDGSEDTLGSVETLDLGEPMFDLDMLIEKGF